jgi:hypothetical protein
MKPTRSQSKRNFDGDTSAQCGSQIPHRLGEFAMPIIAVGAAIAADVIAGSAVLGTVGGIAAISATTAFEVVAAVGATIGAIGVVAKVPALSTAGLVIGAIGGLGALGSAAGQFGSDAAGGASLFGSSAPASTADAATGAGGDFSQALTPEAAASDASSAATYGPTSAFSTGDATAASGATAAQTADQASAGTINFVAGSSPDSTDVITANSASANDSNPTAAQAPSPTPPTASGPSTGLINTSPAVPDPTAPNAAAQTIPGLTGPGTTAATPSQGSAFGGVSSDASNATPNASGQPSYGSTSTFETGKSAGENAGTGNDLANKASSAFGSILSFADAHPVVAYGAVQAAGSLLQGLTSTLTPAQVALANAQAANNQAAANLVTQQTQNLAAPKATAVQTPVTGAPAPLVPQSSGLINSTPQFVNATGAPA